LLARANPCPHVVKWVDEKVLAVEQQIQTLKALQKRLNDFRHICSTSSVMTCSRSGELCCLIEDCLGQRVKETTLMMDRLDLRPNHPPYLWPPVGFAWFPVVLGKSTQFQSYTRSYQDQERCCSDINRLFLRPGTIDSIQRGFRPVHFFLVFRSQEGRHPLSASREDEGDARGWEGHSNLAIRSRIFSGLFLT
jgi:hypothetical protein